MNISHIGQSIIHTPSSSFNLKNILHVPKAKKNLISVHCLASDNDIFLEFHLNFFLIKDQDTKSTLVRGTCQRGLYPLPSALHIKQAFGVNKPSFDRWHSRLGHLATPIIL
uniref:GAG-pre-integrase domain-containing protein n=1 Tax=Arundo donax TaxID=35708 RepID=A0A0A9H3Y0_ARUDO